MLQLQTARLYFERYAEAHLPFIEELVTNPAVMRYIGNGQAKDRAYALQLYARMQQQYKQFDDYGLHILVHKESGAYIGHAGIVAQVIDDTFELELGYWIHPQFWQQGYGYEAAAALAQYANEEIWLERYISAIQVGNYASRVIALKNGMTLEKTITMDGKAVDIYVKLNEWEED